MGRIIHEGLMVSGCLPDEVSMAHKIAIRKFGEKLVSPLSESVVNGYVSFAVFSCGSKHGWDDHEEHLKNIESMEKLLDELCLDYTRVRFGEI